jgi:hypothetical protein
MKNGALMDALEHVGEVPRVAKRSEIRDLFYKEQKTRVLRNAHLII